jgi:hypothetical protein
MANTTWSTTDKSASVTISGGNLIATATAGAQGGRAADRLLTGKFYWEITLGTWSGGNSSVGCGNLGMLFGVAQPLNALAMNKAGNIYINGLGSTFGLGATVAGNVICIALDLTNQLAWMRLGAAGNWNGVAAHNPATSAGGIDISTISGGAIPLYPMYQFAGLTDSVTANFGNTAFAGAVPAGFTSGFTAGVTPILSEVITQLALEHYSGFTPAMTLTYMSVEQWAEVVTTNPYVLLTHTFIDQWASVATRPPDVSSARAMVLA